MPHPLFRRPRLVALGFLVLLALGVTLWRFIVDPSHSILRACWTCENEPSPPLPPPQTNPGSPPPASAPASSPASSPAPDPPPPSPQTNPGSPPPASAPASSPASSPAPDPPPPSPSDPNDSFFTEEDIGTQPTPPSVPPDTQPVEDALPPSHTAAPPTGQEPDTGEPVASPPPKSRPLPPVSLALIERLKPILSSQEFQTLTDLYRKISRGIRLTSDDRVHATEISGVLGTLLADMQATYHSALEKLVRHALFPTYNERLGLNIEVLLGESLSAALTELASHFSERQETEKLDALLTIASTLGLPRVADDANAMLQGSSEEKVNRFLTMLDAAWAQASQDIPVTLRSMHLHVVDLERLARAFTSLGLAESEARQRLADVARTLSEEPDNISAITGSIDQLFVGLDVPSLLSFQRTTPPLTLPLVREIAGADVAIAATSSLTEAVETVKRFAPSEERAVLERGTLVEQKQAISRFMDSDVTLKELRMRLIALGDETLEERFQGILASVDSIGEETSDPCAQSVATVLGCYADFALDVQGASRDGIWAGVVGALQDYFTSRP